MNRYRIVYSTGEGAAATVEFIEAHGAADAIAKLAVQHPRFSLISIARDNRDPAAAAPIVAPDVAIAALARALTRCNTILLALLGNSVFASALTPERLASLEAVTKEAQLALDLATMVKR